MIHFIQHMFHIFLNWTGANNPAGNQYGFFSGFGSDLSEITLVGAVIGWYIHNQCHVETCHKLGKHPFKQYKLCRKHHPDIPDHITHLHIKKLHKEEV